MIRVIGGRGDSAKDLTGLVVIHADGALSSVQCLQSCCLNLSAQSQLHGFFSAGGVIGAREYVIADELIGILFHQAGGNVTIAVTQNMHGGLAKLGAFCIGSAVRGVQQDGSGAVDHHTTVEVAAGIYMGRAEKGGPLSCFHAVAYRKESNTNSQCDGQHQSKPGAFRNPVHPVPPSLTAASPRSWHFVGYLPP